MKQSKQSVSNLESRSTKSCERIVIKKINIQIRYTFFLWAAYSAAFTYLRKTINKWNSIVEKFIIQIADNVPHSINITYQGLFAFHSDYLDLYYQDCLRTFIRWWILTFPFPTGPECNGVFTWTFIQPGGLQSGTARWRLHESQQEIDVTLQLFANWRGCVLVSHLIRAAGICRQKS